ncbi:erythromycin esterase family protein [Fulvivirgaceae bacterium BMA10]|uniref:Erythromycin esterase family protein n=1 Tax=Splendidivirga corallicola TaxID=3051826 RepID=A0ABT8KRM2_9BACT|nr:erythromycin esterase family protein [Fulvivirgaceae bacterium BMA10]
MMKQLHLLVTISIFFYCMDHDTRAQDLKTTWIKENAVKVQSISPEDPDFSDLQALKEILKDTRIVLLGEQTHGGGTTYSAKVRLIKFLHQEMGFEVIAFESGMYDCAKIWQQMQLGNPMEQEVLNSMFYMYATSTEVKPLFPYVDAHMKNSNPLVFTGMDSQHTGEKSKASLADDLKEFLEKHDSKNTTGESWEVFRRKVEDIIAMNREVVDNDKVAFYQILETLKNETANIRNETQSFPDNSGFWLQILESIESQAKRYWGDIQDMDRDRQMADNMSWLLNNPFKDKKVIIWAHNFHIARGLGFILPMGHFLKEEFKDDMYALGFTGYDGSFINFITGNESQISKPSGDSIEQAIKNTGWQYAMVDFINITKKDAWLKQPQKGRLLNFQEQTAIFPNIFDGMFYIQTTTPTVRE